MSEQKKIINKKLKDQLQIKYIKDQLKSVISFINRNKHRSVYIIPLAIFSVLISLYLGYQIYSKLKTLNNNSINLLQLKNYNISSLKLNKLTQKEINNMTTINEVISYQIELKNKIKKYSDYYTTIQNPYDNFLQYIYLPRLNIRKNYYLNTINTWLIWEKFLENNEYDKIKLLNKRSNFFKNVWKNIENNEIKNIEIWDIKETKNWLFKINISVNFISNSKRSFLLLIYKLSTTSNIKNINLINEFFYYLRNNILKEKKEIINKEFNKLSNKEKKEFMLNNEINYDKMIGYLIYKRIKNNKNINIINNEIIEKTIKDSISCDQQSKNECFYLFRDKYRDITNLAYILNNWKNTNSVENLKYFIKNIPPIIVLNNFTFDKINSDSNNKYTKYIWKINIDIYWKSISQNEIENISKILWKQCLNKEIKLNTTEWLNIINFISEQETNLNQNNLKYKNTLLELEKKFKNISENYNNINSYKKVIKLFEIYRMLNENNLCNINYSK